MSSYPCESVAGTSLTLATLAASVKVEVPGPGSTILLPHERPNGFGLSRVECKKTEPNAAFAK